MTTDLLQSIALAILATTQAVQVYLMHRAYRRLWQLEGDVARLLVKQGLVQTYEAAERLRKMQPEDRERT